LRYYRSTFLRMEADVATDLDPSDTVPALA
jgi:hypothetical protein